MLLTISENKKVEANLTGEHLFEGCLSDNAMSVLRASSRVSYLWEALGIEVPFIFNRQEVQGY